MLAVSSETIQVYDVEAKKVLITLKDRVFGPNAVFSPDSKFFTTTTGNGSLGVWELPESTPLLQMNQSALEPPTTDQGFFVIAQGGWVDLSPDGGTLLQLEDDLIRLWDAADGSLLTEQELFSTPKYGLALSPDGELLASVIERGGLQLLAYPDGALVNERFDVPAELASFYALFSGAAPQDVYFLEDGRLIGIADGNISVIPLDGTGEPEILVENNSSSRMAVSSDGALLAFRDSVQGASGVTVRNLNEGTDLFTIPTGDLNVTDLAFSPDGLYIAVCVQGKNMFGVPTYDGATKVYDLATGEFISLFMPGTTSFIDGGHLAFSPDGQYLATASEEHLYLWNMSNRTMVFTDDSPSGDISKLTFSPEGSLLATGSTLGMIALWDAADGALAGQAAGHVLTVTDLLFTSEGSQLISASEDGTIRVWGLKP
jgi:WD40 repeat protein